MTPTILIGLDGATFTILDPLMENGTMPFLKEFVGGGVRADLLSTPNPLTPPAWTSMTTGRSPGNHGIFDFIWAEEREHDHYFTLHSYRDIKAETIWSIVSRQGGTVGSLNFPLMSPPPKVSGYVVPGLVSWKHLRRNVYPRGLYEQLKAIPGFNARELAWDFDLEKKAAKGISEEEYENWVTFHIDRERQWFEVTRHLMQERPSDLLAILFDGLDKILHMGWRFLDPGSFPENPSPWEQMMRDRCTDYFRELDRFLAEISALAGPDARIFMASDHGFGPSWEVLRINTWLHSQGYLTWRDAEELDEKGRESAQRLVDNHFVLLDWNKTTAYARSTTSNGIFIRVAQSPDGGGVPPSQYESFRNELIEKLKEIKDPASGERIVKRVLTKEEAFRGSHNQQAPDLLLVMRDHSFASILNKEPIVCTRPEIEGTHYPEGIFLARGPGIRQGAALPQLSILDVTPALLYSLGLPIPGDLEGRFAEELYEPSMLEDRPCKVGETTQTPESLTGTVGAPVFCDKEEQAEIYKRLQALGYVE
jgi:predicted AlkP superfamily phosphohydrolase/phosphomutase